MLAYPQRFVCRDTIRRALLYRPARLNLHDVTTVPLAVMFEDVDEVTPADFDFVPRVLWVFEHPRDVEVFNRIEEEAHEFTRGRNRPTHYTNSEQ